MTKFCLRCYSTRHGVLERQSRSIRLERTFVISVTANEIRRYFINIFLSLSFSLLNTKKHEWINREKIEHAQTRALFGDTRYYSFLFPVRRLSNLQFHDNGVEVRPVVVDTRDCGPRFFHRVSGVVVVFSLNQGQYLRLSPLPSPRFYSSPRT